MTPRVRKYLEGRAELSALMLAGRSAGVTAEALRDWLGRTWAELDDEERQAVVAELGARGTP